MMLDISFNDKFVDGKILQKQFIDKLGLKQASYMSRDVYDFFVVMFYNIYGYEYSQNSLEHVYKLLYLFFEQTQNSSKKSIQLLTVRALYDVDIHKKIISGELLISDLDKYEIIRDILNLFVLNYNEFIDTGGLDFDVE